MKKRTRERKRERKREGELRDTQGLGREREPPLTDL